MSRWREIEDTFRSYYERFESTEPISSDYRKRSNDALIELARRDPGLILEYFKDILGSKVRECVEKYALLNFLVTNRRALLVIYDVELYNWLRLNLTPLLSLENHDAEVRLRASIALSRYPSSDEYSICTKILAVKSMINIATIEQVDDDVGLKAVMYLVQAHIFNYRELNDIVSQKAGCLAMSLINYIVKPRKQPWSHKTRSGLYVAIGTLCKLYRLYCTKKLTKIVKEALSRLAASLKINFSNEPRFCSLLLENIVEFYTIIWIGAVSSGDGAFEPYGSLTLHLLDERNWSLEQVTEFSPHLLFMLRDVIDKTSQITIDKPALLELYDYLCSSCSSNRKLFLFAMPIFCQLLAKYSRDLGQARIETLCSLAEKILSISIDNRYLGLCAAVVIEQIVIINGGSLGRLLFDISSTCILNLTCMENMNPIPIERHLVNQVRDKLTLIMCRLISIDQQQVIELILDESDATMVEGRKFLNTYVSCVRMIDATYDIIRQEIDNRAMKRFALRQLQLLLVSMEDTTYDLAAIELEEEAIDLSKSTSQIGLRYQLKCMELATSRVSQRDFMDWLRIYILNIDDNNGIPGCD